MELEQIDILGRCIGSTFHPQERSNLEIGFIKRHAIENICAMRIWGRIIGEVQDYIISVAFVESIGATKKKFFFCTNTSPELQQFPEVSAAKREKVAKLRGRLQGDPSAILPDGDNPADPADQDALREVDRLVVMVENIDTATSVVPCGAYVVGPTHAVVQNLSYQGLPWEKALRLENYYHFRPAQREERKAVFEYEGLIRASDFLDPITYDLEGIWNLRKDNTGSLIVLRNLQYPGFLFYHKPQTGLYGSVYVGDGIKNANLAQML